MNIRKTITALALLAAPFLTKAQNFGGISYDSFKQSTWHTYQIFADEPSKKDALDSLFADTYTYTTLKDIGTKTVSPAYLQGTWFSPGNDDDSFRFPIYRQVLHSPAGKTYYSFVLDRNESKNFDEGDLLYFFSEDYKNVPIASLMKQLPTGILYYTGHSLDIYVSPTTRETTLES
ncbi:MAG: hypothetical protein KC535_05855, partial [Nanoarchaeota archaeon]|nr:hypothetical protein [Nanoarchaeota archaeon]